MTILGLCDIELKWYWRSSPSQDRGRRACRGKDLGSVPSRSGSRLSPPRTRASCFNTGNADFWQFTLHLWHFLWAWQVSDAVQTLIESPSPQENKFVTFLLELSFEVDFCPLMVEQGCRVSTENRGDHLVSQPASLFLWQWQCVNAFATVNNSDAWSKKTRMCSTSPCKEVNPLRRKESQWVSQVKLPPVVISGPGPKTHSCD